MARLLLHSGGSYVRYRRRSGVAGNRSHAMRAGVNHRQVWCGAGVVCVPHEERGVD